MPSSDEKRHLARVRAIGCIVCGGAAVAHHIRTGQSSGAGMKSSHFETIPLCPPHHQGHGYGVSYHDGPAIWQRTFGSEVDLLNQVLGILK